MQGTIFLHLSPQFLSPPFSPLPPCSMPDYPPPTLHITLHHPAPHRTTPHTHCTTLHHLSTPLWLWAVLSLRSALRTHHRPPNTQLTTTLHTVAQRSQKWLKPSHINNSHITQRCTK